MITKIEKFSATWCKPCKILSENLKSILNAHPEIEFIEYDADEHSEIFEKMNVKNVPQLLFYNEDEMIIHRLVGLRNTQQINDLIDWHNKIKKDYSPYNPDYLIDKQEI